MADKRNLNTTKHINGPYSGMVHMEIENAAFGPFTVYLTVEGQSPILVKSGIIGPDGLAYADAELPGRGSLVAQTVRGEYTGDKATYQFQDALGRTVDFVFFVKPGVAQEYYQDTAVESIFNLERSASIGISDLSMQFGGSSGSGTGASLTPQGGCCSCSVTGTIGRGVGNVAATGSTTITSGNSDRQDSRGLPMIFGTTHCATELFKGPWGWYRSLGIYRKLLEQNPLLYYGHVSIFRQDATRVSYVNKGSDYESASGNYDSLLKTTGGWFEKTKEGIYFEYNAHGNLKRALDSNRNEHYYLYDSNASSQRLTEIKATKGLRPYFYYDDLVDSSLNTRIALRDPSDSTKNKYLYFKYDSYGYMTKSVGAEGCQWYFDYDRTGSGYNYRGKLTKVTDPDNYTTYYGFDTGG